MQSVLKHRGLRLVFLANMVSMFGSGLNAAAVTWYILEVTGSEYKLALLVMLQTLAAIALLPFTGVIIDREDRRWLLVLLDAGRGVCIVAVALLALNGRAALWEIYAMAVLVAAGFWMFWPTVTALIQELTPESHFVQSNTLLMAGMQGGWLIAGSLVGLLYDEIGLGGILLIDFATYVVSLLCYIGVRKGRHVVERPQVPEHVAMAGEVARYLHEMKEGAKYMLERPALILLGGSFAGFLGAMLSQAVVTAPLSERILHTGAVGFGWLNAAWGTGAFLCTAYSTWAIRRWSGRVMVGISMAVLAAGMMAAPLSGILGVTVALYFVLGSARGVGGIALNTSLMEMVPPHLMGRVQNAFYLGGCMVQLGLGWLVAYAATANGLKMAFIVLAVVFAISSVLTVIPAAAVPSPLPQTLEKE